jgi:hypothetical protein
MLSSSCCLLQSGQSLLESLQHSSPGPFKGQLSGADVVHVSAAGARQAALRTLLGLLCS